MVTGVQTCALPIYRRLFIDTAKRVQPNRIVLAGDTFEMMEFSRYDKDPRKCDIVGSIKWVHDFLGDLRTSSPNSQIDMLAGNHDWRLHKVILGDVPHLLPILDEIAGISYASLLGLDKFECNYISKDDFRAFRETDIQKEIAKNYLICYDTVLFHHFPYAKTWGMPGVNGHHHKHLVTHHYSATNGPYEWHQLGSGHCRQAEYCEGEVWQNGFALCHVNTHSKQVQFEYIDCTYNHCVIGGQWYKRLPSEIITVHSKYQNETGSKII
jgi:hypothetical protein